MICTRKELEMLYHTPLFELISQAHDVHRNHHTIGEIQVCHLINVKEGGCLEDCHYCPQAARYHTNVKAKGVMSVEDIVTQAKQGIAMGASRICLAAAWRGTKEGKSFETLLQGVKELKKLGVETCCSLGLMSETQTNRLSEAGTYAYNHNLDSSETFYKTIISTRLYQDRLKTLKNSANTQMTLCSGGIIGMGESDDDRIELIFALTNLPKTPQSIPYNFLIPTPGTPLEDQPKVSIWEMVRVIATTRILFPTTMIRLAAGRHNRSTEEQALCFFAGVNSLFFGERLLTQKNKAIDDDIEMFKLFGFTKKQSAI